APGLGEQDGGAQSPGLAEKRAGGRPQPLRAKRLVLEQGELPAVERLGERRVAVRLAERGEGVDGGRGPAAVEARRLAGRGRRSDREHRSDSEGTAVEELEEDRARGERGGGRQAHGAHRVGDLAGRVRGLTGRVEIAPERQNAHAVRLAPESL